MRLSMSPQHLSQNFEAYSFKMDLPTQNRIGEIKLFDVDYSDKLDFDRVPFKMVQNITLLR